MPKLFNPEHAIYRVLTLSNAFFVNGPLIGNRPVYLYFVQAPHLL